MCVGIALFLFATALGLIPTDSPADDAPNVVIGICGFVFLIAGAMLMLGRDSKLNDALAAVLLFCFAAVGAWASLMAPDAGFSGGLPFVSREFNLVLGRIVFGTGSLICVAAAVWAIRRARR